MKKIILKFCFVYPAIAFSFLMTGCEPAFSINFVNKGTSPVFLTYNRDSLAAFFQIDTSALNLHVFRDATPFSKNEPWITFRLLAGDTLHYQGGMGGHYPVFKTGSKFFFIHNQTIDTFFFNNQTEVSARTKVY